MRTSTPNARQILLAALILGLIVANRLTLIGDVRMDHDEVRSISRTFGPVWQIINWQPADWPPLYYLTLAGYRLVAGFHPIIIRYSSILLFTLVLAGVYRAARQLFRQRTAALTSVAAYGSLGIALSYSTNVRGYIMAMAVYPFAFGLMLRYFDDEQPRWRNAILLAVALATMFYTTYTIAVGYLMLLVYTLIAYPVRRSLRWWRPGIVFAVLVLPQAIRLATYIVPLLARRGSAQTTADSATSVAAAWVNPLTLLFDYTGGAFWVWVALAALLPPVLVIHRQRVPRTVWALLSIAILGPLIAATLGQVLGMIGTRHSWWAIFPMAWLAGWTIANIPRSATYGMVALLLMMSYHPLSTVSLPDRAEDQSLPPMEDIFRWLQAHMEPGDVLYLDDSCRPSSRCGFEEEWAYYQMVFFPDRRLQIAPSLEATTAARRVWYVHVSGRHDEATEDAIQQGRVAGLFVGPWDFLFQLYEAPPDPIGVEYENGMRFHGFDIIDARLDGYANGPLIRREGEQVTLRLWWSVDRPLDLDYSLSTIITTEPTSQPLVQLDGPPQTVNLFPFAQTAPPSQTSAWEPGKLYVEDRVLQLPTAVETQLREENIGLYLTLYQWWDGQPIFGPGVNEAGQRWLRDMSILAY